MLALPGLLGGIYLGSELVLAARRRSGDVAAESVDRGSLRVLWLSIAAGIALSLTVAVTAPTGRYALGPLGIAAVAALFAVAIALRWWAILVLGRFFTVDVTLHEDHAVVTAGPYAYVRHPSYTGALLAFVALGASFESWWAVPLMLLLIVPAFVYRIFVEEAALTRGLGDEYRRYCARTWRLVPWVW